jgi:hypothetical protein
VKPKPPPVDNNRKRNRDEDEGEASNVNNSGAKKLAVNNSGAKKLATDSKAMEAHLVKLIKSLADDLDAKVTLTKGDIATLIEMLAKQCMEKFREAMEAGAKNVVITRFASTIAWGNTWFNRWLVRGRITECRTHFAWGDTWFERWHF